MKIFVAGLPYDLDDAELEEIFEKFGKVNSAKVAMDKETGKSKGFGFIDMPNSVGIFICFPDLRSCICWIRSSVSSESG